VSEPLQLLLVEDSATDAKLVIQEIRRAGHTVEFERVEDPTAMRAALAAKGWDAIIADWSMPRFSALAALGVVKEYGLDVPFVIVSGTVGEEPAVEAMRAGAHDYVLKDRLARLAPVLERELREANMRKAHRQSELAERRAVEAGLRESERQVRQLVENLPDLAWSARPDGHIDFYNRPWYEYTGSTFEQMEGWGWKAAHSPEMVDAVLENWTRSLTTGEPFEMEFPLRRADGTFRWFLTRVRPLRDAEGRIARWFGTSTDIDEARRARAEREQLVADLRKAVELRDEFLSIASHELRTPLTALQLQLQGTTHLVERLNSPGNAKFLGKLEVASRQANRLAVLVDGLLDVARTSLGRLTLELDEVDLVTIARDVIEQYTVQAQSAGCSIQLETEPQVVGCWDRARLEQVVTNLVTNSIKYGGGHPIEVCVTSADGWARLVVRDHGIGIHPEDVIRVFARFERAVSSKHYGGLGLGLYIARQIAEAHGGTIDVASEVDHGATFTVNLRIHPELHNQRVDQAVAEAQV
jgi:PAS domain S-box-containing protein